MSAREDGFTLAEMLVVLAILALTAGLALPVSRLSGEGAVFDLFVRDVASGLRMARVHAISENREASVLIDLKARVVGLDGAGKRILVPANAALEIVTDKAGISPTVASFRFFPDGSAAGGHISISQNRFRKRIDVDWLTGVVSIIDIGTNGN
jgi:general secretion pathway protein H